MWGGQEGRVSCSRYHVLKESVRNNKTCHNAIMPTKRPREAAPNDLIPVPDFIECYRSIKVGLKNLLKDSHALSKIEALVLRCNIFVTEAYQFIRLFILHKFHRHAPLPKIDRAFIICVFMTLGTTAQKGSHTANRALKAELEAFYQAEFKSVLTHVDKLDRSHMSQVFEYQSNQIYTAISNNALYIRIIQRRFEVVLIDEFRTSKLCCHCHKELSHRYVQGQQLWRALICRGCREIPSNKDRSLNNNRFLNRDVNAAVNIMNMAKHWVFSHNRPPEFSR